jgi:hypothetical protein
MQLLFFKKSGPQFVLICIGIISALVLLKYNTLNAPFHWDVMGFAVPAAENIYNHGVFVAKTGSTGHPPLFLAILALTWKIFGKSLFVSHFLNIILGALGLTSLFFLANRLYGIKVAITSFMFLLFNQTFFTQVGIVYLSIPLMSSAILTVYAYIQRKYWLYLVSAVSMLLIKETSLIVLGSILLYEIFVSLSKREKIIAVLKRTSALAIPVIPLIAWFLAHYLTTGYVFKTARVFINKGNFFSTFLKNFMKHFIYDSSIENFNRTNWIILIFITVFFISSIKRKLKYEKLFLLIILLNVTLFSLTDDLPRYFLITFPFFLLMGARASVSFTEQVKIKGRIFLLLAIISLYVGFSVMNYHGTRQTDGWRLESNMEYLDMVRLHVKVCEFIQKKHESAWIMTNSPLYIALQKPWYGYVDKPLKVIDFSTLERTENTIIVWSAQSNFGPVVNFMHKNIQDLRQIREFFYKGKRVRIFKFAQ